MHKLSPVDFVPSVRMDVFATNFMSSGLELSLQTATGVHMVFCGVTAYEDALQAMEVSQQLRRQDEIPDTFYYLEHLPVITYGRATPIGHLHRKDHNLPMQEVPRGGLATYHGPGQLVGYGIIDLAKRGGGLKPDIHVYLRSLEQGLTDFLQTKYDLPAVQKEGHAGVWIEDGAGMRKIASIGVSARHWISAHGFALNLDTDLEAFRAIVPCGLGDVEMTSVAREFDRAGAKYEKEPMLAIAQRVHVHVCNALHENAWCRVR